MGKNKGKKKTWEIKKQHVKLFSADLEDVAQFELRINKFFDELKDYTVEQDWYFPELGFYFVRYMQTHYKKSRKQPKGHTLMK